MQKFIPIHGIRFTNSITLSLKIKHILNEEYTYYDNIQFWTYKDYSDFISKNQEYFINSDEINKCDSIAVYVSQAHNTIEVFNIKLLISIIYFAKRLSDTNGSKEKYIKEFLDRWGEILSASSDKVDLSKLEDMANRKYFIDENEFFKNYDLKGYWGEGYIHSDRWHVKLGNNKVSRDDFDRYITRGFSATLCDEYDRQVKFTPDVVSIETNDIFLNELSMLLNKINEEDEYSKKLKSAVRIYYDALGENNIDNLIVTYTTLLEALLLKKSEQQAQKIRVAVRCACIVADEQCKSRKTFIANIISCLYSYRNQIVHEGKTFLELGNEVAIDRVLSATKHIIYLCIKYIVKNDFRKVNEVIKVVESNLKKDNLQNGEEYITFEKGKAIALIYMGDDE